MANIFCNRHNVCLCLNMQFRSYICHLQRVVPLSDAFRSPQVNLPLLEQRDADGKVASFVQKLHGVNVHKFDLERMLLHLGWANATVWDSVTQFGEFSPLWH